MISKAFMCIYAALLVFGLPGAFPQEAPPAVPSKEAKSADKPVMLGDKILVLVFLYIYLELVLRFFP